MYGLVLCNCLYEDQSDRKRRSEAQSSDRDSLRLYNVEILQTNVVGLGRERLKGCTDGSPEGPRAWRGRKVAYGLTLPPLARDRYLRWRRRERFEIDGGALAVVGESVVIRTRDGDRRETSA